MNRLRGSITILRHTQFAELNTLTNIAADAKTDQALKGPAKWTETICRRQEGAQSTRQYGPPYGTNGDEVHSAGVTDSNLSLVAGGSSFGYIATIFLLQHLSLEVKRCRKVRSGGKPLQLCRL